MRYRSRRGRRRNRKWTLAILLLLTAVFLVSCVAGSNPLWIRSMFGIDAANYRQETAEATLATDGQTAEELCDVLGVLLSGSLELQPFQSTAQAVKYYRDAVLNDMLRDHYSAYTGNTALLSAAEAAYPHTVLSTLIPKADFENAVYRVFGGTAVRHASGNVFSYLARSNAYTAPLQAWEITVGVEVRILVETAHTYRMEFVLFNGTEESAVYTAVFVKREDGNPYIYSLSV